MSKPKIIQDIETLQTNLNLVQSELWKTIYPVGCLFETTDSAFNPQTHFGGTWSLYGEGRVTVGYAAGETEFNAGGKTGGSKTHTLTEAQMPSHTHQLTYGTNALGPGNRVTVTSSDGPNYSETPIGIKGGGQAHNNLQPYITVFRWRRTA